jgi:sulfur-oxidizing protein SoxX
MRSAMIAMWAMAATFAFMAAPVLAQVSAAGAAPAAAPAAAVAAPAAAVAAPAAAEPALAHYTIVGDGIPAPLAGATGNAARGRAIVADRQTGLCLLCHAAPIPEQRFQGNLGPDLTGTGARWTPAQLRLRMVDARRQNPESVMPSYYRVEGLTRVAPALRGKPILSAQQIEDVVAYLASLQTRGGVLPPMSPPASPQMSPPASPPISAPTTSAGTQIHD